jgi:hypothetical protein
METIWAPWLTREATHCRVWPTSGPPGPPPGTGIPKGLGALVVGAGAAEGPPVGSVEGLVQGLGGPALADGGQVDGADGQGVGAPESPRALPAAAWRVRSKLPAAGAFGALRPAVLPAWAVASPVSVASLAFTGIVSRLTENLAGFGRQWMKSRT